MATKIAIRGGHTPNCKGAMGYLDEQKECLIISKKVMEKLKARGWEVLDCNNTLSTQTAELSYATNKANNWGANYFVSIHMNAGHGEGSEVWFYDGSNPAPFQNAAKQVLKNLNKLGFANRGVKYNKSLHDLNSTKMPAAIIEVCFVDTQTDAEKFNFAGYDVVAEAIAAGICQEGPFEGQKKDWVACDSWVKIPGGVEIHCDKYRKEV